MYEKTYHTRVLKTDTKSLSPREKTRRRRFSWKKLLLVLSVLAIFLGVGYLIRSPRLQVREITVIGTTVLDIEDIKMHVRDGLAGTRLWILPKTSIFLINEQVIERSLQAAFPRIETIKVKRNSFHGLEISINEFDALYLWCSESVTDCYFMDKQGVVYSDAPVFSGTAYPKVVTSVDVDTLPFQAFSITEINRVSELERRLSEINITPTVFTYVSEREITIDFLHNKDIATIKIDPATPTDTSLEYIFSGIRTEPLSSLFNNPEKKLLYIDVRFPSKVVYKFDTNE